MARINLERVDTGFIRLHSHGKVQTSILCSMYNNAASLFDVTLTGGSRLTTAIGNGILACDNLPPIRAHKAILAQASPHLHGLFTSQGFLDSNQTKYTITNIDHESLDKIVKFVYTDNVEMQDDDVAVESVQGIIAGAKYLIMTELAEACEEFLAGTDQIKAHNCIDLFQFAYKYSCPKLLEAACAFIAGNLLAISQSVKFLELIQDECAKFMLSEPVVAACADDRCRAAIAWLSHKSPSRAESAECIMSMAALDAEGVSPDTLLLAARNAIIRPTIKGISLTLINAFANIHQQQNRRSKIPQVDEPQTTPANESFRGEAWYIIGGSGDGRALQRYDVAQRQWTLLQSLPHLRCEAYACAIDKRVIVVGGPKPTARAYHRFFSTAIDEYDTLKQCWSTSGAKLHRARAQCAVASDSESVYVFGGEGESPLCSQFTERYCLNTNKIRKLANMSRPRTFAAAACFENGVVFVAGGIANDDFCGDVIKYNYASNSWSTICKLKTPRGQLAATFMGDDLYIAGGCGTGGAFKQVEILNVRTGQLRSDRELIQSRTGCAAVPLDQNVMCVLGGYSNDGLDLSSVETYDVREGKWAIGNAVPDMPIGTSWFGCAHVRQ